MMEQGKFTDEEWRLLNARICDLSKDEQEKLKKIMEREGCAIHIVGDL